MIACTAAALLWTTALAQDAEAPPVADDEFEGLYAPSAYERELALQRIPPAKLIAYYRNLLDSGVDGPAVVPALDRLALERDVADIPRFLRYIADLDPSVALAANGALAVFGAEALSAIEKMDPAAIDPATKTRVMERMLREHIRRCCMRDMSVNPYFLDYEGRFDELYSVPQDVEALIFTMLRESINEVRDDISGMRYYGYYRFGMTYEMPFLDYGALAIAALARHRPEELWREVRDLRDNTSSDDYWWGYGNRAAVTVEIATFMARRGETGLIDKFISQFEGSTRWFGGGSMLGLHVRVAALQINALNEHSAALVRLNENLRSSTPTGQSASHAHFLRARILMHLGEHGAALHALEESMEVFDNPLLLPLVDATFAPLAGERRFQAIISFCNLAARRQDPTQRPWVRKTKDGE